MLYQSKNTFPVHIYYITPELIWNLEINIDYFWFVFIEDVKICQHLFNICPFRVIQKIKDKDHLVAGLPQGLYVLII